VGSPRVAPGKTALKLLLLLLTDTNFRITNDNNNSKCSTIYFGNHNIHTEYFLHGTTLSETQTIRDLGVVMSNCGSVSLQCSTVAKKARRLTGLMLRTFDSRKRNVIVPLLKTIIRPVVEYATAVWNPCYVKDIADVKNVQRKVTKSIRGLSHLTYADRLRQLNLPTLETRRQYFDLLECFKIVHGTVRSECSTAISLSENRTRGYQSKVTSLIPTARSNVRKHFFAERVLTQWNSLPNEIVQLTSYRHFKSALRIHLSVN